LAAFASLLFPGAGQGFLDRRVRMGIFAGAHFVATVLSVVSVWFVVVSLAIRVVAAVDVLVGRDGAENLLWAGIAGVVGVGALVFGQFAFDSYAIPSESMVPTLRVGDHVLVDTLDATSVERGEVIVFDQPCAKVVYVKRVIGLPGDSVEVRCGVVYVNGKAALRDGDRETLDGRTYQVAIDGEPHDFPMRDRLIAPSCSVGNFYESKSKQPVGKIVDDGKKADACAPQLHFVVPAGGYFVMGDNRNHANDSRYWGVVPVGSVIGRVVGVALPVKRLGDL
jgi:signal peptidase I